MFGQWFYSLAIWAKEIRVKTWVWDWKTTYVNMKPIYNDNKDIIDFGISYEVKDENYKWTLIERTDDEKWITWNFKALVWVNNIVKYAWNLDDVELEYNWEQINKPENREIIEEIYVEGIEIDEKVKEKLSDEEIKEWLKLKLIKIKNKKERLTKDNLFMSEIPDDFLEHLPDFIIKHIRTSKLSLDIPALIEPTKSRNSMANSDKDLKILKPYIFTIISKFIVK